MINNDTKFSNINSLIKILNEHIRSDVLRHNATRFKGRRILRVPLFKHFNTCVQLKFLALKSGRMSSCELETSGEKALEDFLACGANVSIKSVHQIKLSEDQSINGYTPYLVTFKVFGTPRQFSRIALVADNETNLYGAIVYASEGTIKGSIMYEGNDWDGDISPNSQDIFNLWKAGTLNDRVFSCAF